MSTKEDFNITPEGDSQPTKGITNDLQCILALVLCLIISICSITMSSNNTTNSPVSSLIPVALMNLLFLTVSYILMIRTPKHVQNLEIAFLLSFVSIILHTLPDGLSIVCLPFCLIVAPSVLWVTGNYVYTLVSLAIELINIGLSFRSQLLCAIRENPAESIADMITYSLILGCFVMVLLTGYSILENNKTRRIVSDKSSTVGNEQPQNNLICQKVLKNFVEESKALINTLTGSLELLSGSMEDGIGSKLVQIATLTTENLNRNLNNISSSNVDNTKPYEPDFTPTDIKGLFCQIWTNISLMLKKNDLKGNLIVDRSFPESIQIESSKVKQVVMNLADYIMERDEKSAVNVEVEHIDPFMDDNFCIEEESTIRLPHFDSEIKLTEESTSTSIRSLEAKEEANYGKKPMVVKSKNTKILKIMVGNCNLRATKKIGEGFFVEIEHEDEIVKPPKSEMAKLGLKASEIICEQLGGKLQTQIGSNNEIIFTAYVPFEIYAKNQIKVRGLLRTK